MANPFASNVNQGIVDQANADPLLQAAVRGDPQAKAQILAVVRQGADPYHAQFLDYQQSQPGGVSIEDLSKLYLQTKSGNPNSPVYYNPQTGQFHDQQKDSALFRIAQIAPGAIGGGLALAGLGAAGGAAGSAPELGAGGESLSAGLGGAGAVGPGGAAAEAGTAGGLGAAGDITGELGSSTGTASGGVPQVLGGAGSKAGSLFGGAGGSSLMPYLLNTGMRLGGAAYGAHAAGKASEQQQQNVQKALDLQKSLYGQSQAALMPYYTMGAGSLGRLQSFLGTPSAAPLPSGTLGNLGK